MCALFYFYLYSYEKCDYLNANRVECCLFCFFYYLIFNIILVRKL